jgi:anaerobic magnesium-protoporphyrin IX monomethyl ester cyclase
MTAKVVLINPPHPYLADQKRNQPLGLMYLGAVLEKENYDVKLIDLCDINEEDWIKKIPEADIFGISATTVDYFRSIKIAKKLKDCYKKCIIVLGGAHATAVYKTVDKIFDKVVIGEGELAFLDILNDYKNNIDRRFYQHKHIENIDTVPFPARHLLPLDSIISYNLVEKGKAATSLITSRGCDYNCSFCASKTMWGQRVRFRSPDNIIQELEQIIRDYGVHYFRFHDDTMTLNKKRLLELCKKMIPLNIHWRAHTRVDHSDMETLVSMKNAGCDEIGYGIESASQEVLNIINKKINIEQAKQAIKNVKDAGLRVRLFFIVGLPGETKDTTKKNIEFIDSVQPDGVDVSTFIPFPGCDIYEKPRYYCIEMLTKDYEKFVMSLGLCNNEADTDFIYKHHTLTNEELKKNRLEMLNYIIGKQMVLNR